MRQNFLYLLDTYTGEADWGKAPPPPTFHSLYSFVFRCPYSIGVKVRK